jgi:predicted Zn-dependent protease with MMP-like domain
MTPFFIMEKIAFEKLVERALQRLPRRFKKKLGNIFIEVEPAPDPDLLRDMGISSGTLFGLYQGVPLTEREWNFGNVLPDRIVIYQRPIEAEARSSAEMEEIVMDTVMHEIGHYFGFDDASLYAIEDEKAGKKKNNPPRGHV